MKQQIELERDCSRQPDENAVIKVRKTDERICVVLVVDDLGYGGAEGQVVELANNLDKSRFDVHICTLSNHIPFSNKLRNPEHVVHTVIRKSRFDITVVIRLAYLLRKLKADIVHGFLFSAEIASRLAGRMAGTKVVVGSERNANRIEIRKRSILAYRFTQRCVDVIIANSNAGAKSHGRIYNRPPSDYRVVHNGVDTERFRPKDGTTIRKKLGIPVQCPVVGVFAAFRKQKNHSMLFRAFKLVLDSFPEARLLIVGDQPADQRRKTNSYKVQLDRLPDDLGIRHRCMFLGHQGNTEHLYPACDVTVLSSLHEGTPNVLLESMACGVPVVATNVCDNEYIIRDGEVGYLVAVGDEAGMADRMELLLGNSVLRKEMGRKARKWVLGEFSTKRLAEKMEFVYMELLNGKRKQRCPPEML